jgi:hypothetical protein
MNLFLSWPIKRLESERYGQEQICLRQTRDMKKERHERFWLLMFIKNEKERRIKANLLIFQG